MSNSLVCSVTQFLVLAATLSCALATPASAQSAPTAKPRDRIVLAHALPKLDGADLKATAVEVYYGPGESSRPHSHGCAVLGYVVQGSIRTQVKGEAERIVPAGEGFFEAPHGVHLVSANASQTEPADFIAFFVCDRDQPLSTALPDLSTKGGR